MDEVFALQLGGISFQGGAGNDGCYVRGIVGWDALPDARGSLDAIPGSDGSFRAVDLYRESRVVTVVGVLAAGDRAGVEALRARLMAILKAHATLTVTDELGTLSSEVRVDSISFSDEGTWATWIDFTIDLVAPDPVRYRDMLTVGPVGLPTQVGGLVLPSAFPWHFGTSSREVATVVNDGTVPVLPRVTVAGSAASVTILGGPYRLEFGAFDGVLVFDSLDRRVWLNGTDVTRQLVRRDWPVVAAGVTAEFSFEAVSPSPNISLLVEYSIGVW